MGDNFYSQSPPPNQQHQNRYSPPPPPMGSSTGVNYGGGAYHQSPHMPSQAYQGGQTPQPQYSGQHGQRQGSYAPTPPHSVAGGYYDQSRNQSQYYGPQGHHNSYQPPTDDYRYASPMPQHGQMNRYENQYPEYNPQDYAHRPSAGSYVGAGGPGGNQNYRGSEAGHYPPPHHGGNGSRPGSRVSGEMERGKPKGKYDTEKSLGAMLLGGAAGAFVGHKVAPGLEGLGPVAGALAGAWGGKKFEEKREKKKMNQFREDKEQQQQHRRASGDYDRTGSSAGVPAEGQRDPRARRSSSRGRSASRSRSRPRGRSRSESRSSSGSSRRGYSRH